ncbi:MAG: hypothetical protein PHP35_02500 [Candidatus Colwellbacteria bacterium]|nr:hypothetical protein [Candidatus Colwellbacteria bacterium]
MKSLIAFLSVIVVSAVFFILGSVFGLFESAAFLIISGIAFILLLIAYFIYMMKSERMEFIAPIVGFGVIAVYCIYNSTIL